MSFTFGNSSNAGGSFTFGNSSNNNNSSFTFGSSNNSNNSNNNNNASNNNNQQNNNGSNNTNNNNNNKKNNNNSFNFGSNPPSNSNNAPFAGSSNNNNSNTLNNSFNFGGNNNNNNNNNNSSLLWGSNNNTNNNNNNNNNNNSFNFGNNQQNNNNNNNQMNIGDNMNPLNDIQRIYNEYDAKHPLCRFESVLYNKIPSNLNVNSFDKPPLIRTQIWDQGIKNNPSPSKLVPVGIRGYDELNQRSNLCLAGHCSAIKRFQEISEKINKLKDDINIRTKQKITDLKQTQIYLSHRLLAILRTYVIQINSNQINQNQQILENNTNINNLSMNSMIMSPIRNNLNNYLNPKEVKLKNVLNQLMRETKQLINLYGHINKLSAQFDINHNDNNINNNNNNNGAHIDGDIGGDINKYNINNTIHLNDIDHPNQQNMKQMFGFLKQQQQFIQLLNKTVQSDMKDLNIITNGIQTKQNNNSPQHSILFNNNTSAIF